MTIEQIMQHELFVAAIPWARALLVTAIGWALARGASSALGQFASRRLSAQYAMLVRRLVYYGLLGIVFATVMTQLGFDLSVLIGAAGVLTVAVGFASQTSASNVISGLFLVGEQPFVVGDIIRVGTTQGVVVSVDLLSVKLRTFDNLLVRVPNETLLKSEIVNVTAFPVRRVELQIGIAYKESYAQVERVLLEVADTEPLCLDEPEPMILHLGYGDSAVLLQFNVWGARENFIELRSRMYRSIKDRFDAEGIEIPFPHRTLYLGEPMDVNLKPGDVSR